MNIRGTVTLGNDLKIQFVQLYRLPGGYHLLVTKAGEVWQEYKESYLCLATSDDWARRCGKDAPLTLANACRAANRSPAVSPYETALRRVEQSPTLRKFKAIIMQDWPEGDEHWRWVRTAPVREIAAWARNIHNNCER